MGTGKTHALYGALRRSLQSPAQTVYVLSHRIAFAGMHHTKAAEADRRVVPRSRACWLSPASSQINLRCYEAFGGDKERMKRAPRLVVSLEQLRYLQEPPTVPSSLNTAA